MGETYTSGIGFGFLRLNGTIVVREGLSDKVTIQLYGTSESSLFKDSASVIPSYRAEAFPIADFFDAEGAESDGVTETVLAAAVPATNDEPFAISDSAAVT